MEVVHPIPRIDALDRGKQAPARQIESAIWFARRRSGTLARMTTIDPVLAQIAAQFARLDARYAGLTGAPDESGRKSREKGLAKAGNARVRRGMIQLAWRFLRFQSDSAVAQWYRAVTKDGRGAIRKIMIVALVRKLLIVFWRMVTVGEIPENVALRAA
jgi:transposase